VLQWKQKWLLLSLLLKEKLEIIKCQKCQTCPEPFLRMRPLFLAFLKVMKRNKKLLLFHPVMAFSAVQVEKGYIE
jgi:hypothetical protein